MLLRILEDHDEFKVDILTAYGVRPDACKLQYREVRKVPVLGCANYLQKPFQNWLANEQANS